MRSLTAAVLVAVLAPTAAHAQDWRTISQSRAFGGEDALKVDIAYGAGQLELRPGADGMLYRARLRYDAETFTPDLAYRNGRLSLDIEGGNIKGRNMRSGNLNVALGTAVPIDLDLKFGAAEATLDLGGLRLSRLHIATGASKTLLTVDRANPQVCRSVELEVGAAQFEATGLGNLRTERLSVSGGVGEVTLDFTGRWDTDMVADIDMGLGSLTLRVPRGLGVQVRKSGLLAGFDSEGLIKRGDVYLSDNWERADHRLTINLDAALGAIRVAWVDD